MELFLVIVFPFFVGVALSSAFYPHKQIYFTCFQSFLRALPFNHSPPRGVSFVSPSPPLPWHVAVNKHADTATTNADTSGFSVWRRGVAVAFGAAGVALLSSFFALGALLGNVGFSLTQALSFSLFCFALPGQLLTAELFASSADTATVAFAVWVVNARLLPMTIFLLPLLTEKTPIKKRPRWSDFALSHLVAVTSWVYFLGSYKTVPPPLRRLYFIIVGGLLWVLAAVATALGHAIGNLLSHDWLIGLLFVNPLYFLCMMLRSLFSRSDAAAFFGGMLLLPVAATLAPQWDIIIAGGVAGCLAFFIFERRQHPRKIISNEH